MKPIIATGLSLVGILGAGALAAGANLRVFDGPDDSSPAGAATAEAPAPIDVAAGDSETGRVDAVGVQTFQVGTAGTITLDASGGLHLVDVTASPGWRAEQQEDAAVGQVVVDFETEGNSDVTATAILSSEGIRVAVRGEDDSGAPVYGSQRDDDSGTGRDLEGAGDHDADDD